jgi:hypothetical protein
MEYIPETVYVVSRHYAKAKQVIFVFFLCFVLFDLVVVYCFLWIPFCLFVCLLLFIAFC